MLKWKVRIINLDNNTMTEKYFNNKSMAYTFYNNSISNGNIYCELYHYQNNMWVVKKMDW